MEYLQKPFLKEFRLHQDHSEDIFSYNKMHPMDTPVAKEKAILSISLLDDYNACELFAI